MPITRIRQSSCIYCTVYIAMPINRIRQTCCIYCIYCDAYNQDFANKPYTVYVYCDAYNKDLANKLYILDILRCL